MTNVEDDESWMMSIICYLKGGRLLDDKKKARKMECRLAYFFIENGRVYKKGFALPLLLCLHPNKANFVMREIHEGIFGSHLARTTIELKFVRSLHY